MRPDNFTFVQKEIYECVYDENYLFILSASVRLGLSEMQMSWLSNLLRHAINYYYQSKELNEILGIKQINSRFNIGCMI